MHAKVKNCVKAKYDKSIINYQFNPTNALFLQHRASTRNPVEPGFPHAESGGPSLHFWDWEFWKSSAKTSN